MPLLCALLLNTDYAMYSRIYNRVLLSVFDFQNGHGVQNAYGRYLVQFKKKLIYMLPTTYSNENSITY